MLALQALLLAGLGAGLVRPEALPPGAALRVLPGLGLLVVLVTAMLVAQSD